MMRGKMNIALRMLTAIVGIWICAGSTSFAASFDTRARQALLIDLSTGAVLLEKNARSRMPPASMSKLMTAYLIFERLKDGTLTKDSKFPVSRRAAKKGGSKMFLRAGDRERLEDLLRGIVIQSGNDACIVVAEGIAGSEAAFAKLMNRKAKELGLKDSNFANATGWPDPEHYMTAVDLALLARRILEDFPEFYHFYAERSFRYNRIKQKNRNPVLGVIEGADGLKTGFTNLSGYGLTASAERNGRRLIMVINGLDSKKDRSSEAERLLNWGFGAFGTYKLLSAGETVETADLWLGQQEAAALVLEKDLIVTLPRASRAALKVMVRYEGPTPAPVYKGEELGTLIVTAPGVDPIERPLFAAETVERQGPVGRVIETLSALVSGAWR
jgi:D-alanyl-D-alanine carboxypeptidase (penicillin-binding protein 5/6)